MSNFLFSTIKWKDLLVYVKPSKRLVIGSLMSSRLFFLMILIVKKENFEDLQKLHCYLKLFLILAVTILALVTIWALNQAYFWPTVNKRLTRLWPDPMTFFLPKWQKIEKFGIFRGKFPNPNPNQRWLTQPNLTQVKKFWSRPITKILTNWSRW